MHALFNLNELHLCSASQRSYQISSAPQKQLRASLDVRFKFKWLLFGAKCVSFSFTSSLSPSFNSNLFAMRTMATTTPFAFRTVYLPQISYAIRLAISTANLNKVEQSSSACLQAATTSMLARVRGRLLKLDLDPYSVLFFVFFLLRQTETVIYIYLCVSDALSSCS